MSSYETYEDRKPLKTSLAATDKIRVVVGGISGNMYPEAFAGQISQYLTSVSGKVKVRAMTSSGSINSTDNVVLVNGTFTATLPNPSTVWDSASSKSNVIYVMNKATSGTTTLDQYASESIYSGGVANTSITLAAGVGAVLVTDGTNWYNLVS